MAKMSGVPTLQRIIRYLLPNILSQILVTAFLDIGNMMISLAGLSFLGLASQPPQPEWGAMLYESGSLDDVFSRTCFIYLCANF